MLDESNRKSNKMRVDKSSEFYDKSVESIFQKIAMEMKC